MKFRYKVLIINIIFLSIGIGTVGFFMIDKNFDLALLSHVENAIEENNIIQANIEYFLLDSMSRNDIKIETQLTPSVSKLKQSFSSLNVILVCNDKIIYADCSCPESLWKDFEMRSKKYIISQEDDKYYIYVASYGTLSNAELCIINQKDITSVYKMTENQIMHFRYLLIIVVSVCSVALFIISRFLTKPLEDLTKAAKSFGDGDYKTRVTPHSNDEITILSNTYNQMADSVENHIDELNEMLLRQDQFVSDFTHEIKTPLTSIIGYSDTLRSKEVSREAQILASSYIFSEGKRLEAMSMKLFDLIYTKHHSVSFLPFHINKLTDIIITSITPALEAKNITLCTDFEESILYGDIDLLASAFINILDNAKKASKNGDKIIFSGKIHDESYIISITDFGIGISEEHIDKICNEFYMINKSRSRSEGGAGLGLSLASYIFSSHNAAFDIKSKLGEGTTMTVTLSLKEKKEEPDEK